MLGEGPGDAAEVVSKKTERKGGCCGGKKGEGEDEAKELHPVSTRRVWGYAKGQYGLVALGLMCSTLSGAVWPLLAVVFSEMLSAFGNFDEPSMRQEVP